MRVNQARGGTSRPGIPPSIFTVSAAKRMRYDVPNATLSSCVTGYAIYIDDERVPSVNMYLPAQAMIVILVDAGPVAVRLQGNEYANIDKATVWGPTSRAFRTTSTGGISVGIGLTATGWARFTAHSAGSLRDRVVPLSDFVGATAVAELLDALEALNDDAHIAPLLDAMLPAFFARDHPETELIDALSRLVLTNGLINVEQVSQRLNITKHTLRRISTQYFGMTPKTLLTRARFVRSITNWLMNGEPDSYAGIDTSYFDIAHFLLDARTYLDTTPRRFAKLEIAFLRASLRARDTVIGGSTHVLHVPGTSNRSNTGWVPAKQGHRLYGGAE